MEIVTLNRHGADHRRASYANLRQLVPTHVGLWRFKVTFSIIVTTFPTYVKSEEHYHVFKTALNWILQIIIQIYMYHTIESTFNCRIPLPSAPRPNTTHSNNGSRNNTNSNSRSNLSNTTGSSTSSNSQYREENLGFLEWFFGFFMLV